MYVKDHMTVNPVTITAETSLSKALELMGKNHFHRLPVVDGNNKLIGLITEGLVNDTSGRNATALSIYELNYLLSRTSAKDIMIRDVHTVSPDVFLEEAAEIMLENTINVLPVVDFEQHVVGIITEKDIFQTLVELMGLKQQGTRFVMLIDDKPGVFAKVTKLFGDAKANVENLAVYHTDRGSEVVVKATGEIPVEQMINILRDAGFTITNVVQTTKEGKTVVWLNEDKQ
ncbi:MAG: CBS domain-containing protein [Erysipelotrichaceae bacterium]|nr:CBS domain-containing protein [Erysipelotrichaceae bacterium]